MKTFLEYVKNNGIQKPAVIASCVLAVILGFAHTPLFFTLSFLIAAMTFFPEKINIMNNSDSVIKCAVIGLFVFSLLLGPGSYTLFFMQTLALLLINFMPTFLQLLPTTFKVKECLPRSISVLFEGAEPVEAPEANPDQQSEGPDFRSSAR